MKCPKCNSLMNEDDVQCLRCGWLNKNAPITNKKKTYKKDIYLETFIGEKINYFREKDVNIFFFIFGPFYYLYRKMYISGIIYLLFQLILLFFLGNLIFKNTLIILFLFNFLLSIKVNKKYLKFAEEKVSHIKKRYDDFTDEQILMICKKVGFPDYLMVLLAIIVSTFLILFSLLFRNSYINFIKDLKFNEKDEIKKQEEISKDNDLINSYGLGIIDAINIKYITPSENGESISLNTKYSAKDVNVTGTTIISGEYEIKDNGDIILYDVSFNIKDTPYICNGNKATMKCQKNTQ